MKLLHAVAILPLSLLLSATTKTSVVRVSPSSNIEINTISKKSTANLYSDWNLKKSGLSKNAFDYAKKGFDNLVKHGKLLKSSILTIVDFSKASNQKRFFIVDMAKGLLLNSSLVAHGKNSGTVYATDFSNEIDSYKSSVGFFITKGTYDGSNGYSLKLDGLEKGYNDNAESRAIVVHGAAYVSEEHIKNAGYLGRSYGCPALPNATSEKIINKIKGGSCMFIYSPFKKYLTNSKILNS